MVDKTQVNVTVERLIIMDLKSENLIEKSKALVWAKFREYSAGELKLLEVYLSRINARDPESSEVTFTLAEYARLLGISDLRFDLIEKYTDNLLKQVVTIRTPGVKRGFRKYPLFQRAICVPVDPNSEKSAYIISLKCNNDLQDVFFSLKENGYTQYRLRSTIKLNSKYSLLLYSLLRDMIYKKEWEITVEQLREQLGIAPDMYEKFRDLNRRVIGGSVAEINEKTDLKVEYETVARGRKVVAIKFKARIKESEKKKRKRKNFPAVPAMDGHFYAEATDFYLTDESAMKMAELILNLIQEFYPNIPPEIRPEAAKATLRAAYIDIVENSNTPELKPGAKIWTVLRTGQAIADYIPADYTLMGINSEPFDPSQTSLF